MPELLFKSQWQTFLVLKVHETVKYVLKWKLNTFMPMDGEWCEIWEFTFQHCLTVSTQVFLPHTNKSNKRLSDHYFTDHVQ